MIQLRNFTMNEYTMIIRVDAEEGEENYSIQQLSDYDMEILEPMLLCIQSHRGHYPKNRPKKPYEPTARELYHDFIGWDIFESLLPNPKSGFSTILTIKVYRENPYTLEML